MQVFNPYLPSWEYVPDGEPRVFGDRLYLFGSHDRFGGDGYCLNDYVCWSTPVNDLSAWRYDGIIYSVKDDPLNPKLKHHGYAPDCVQGPDGRFYLFYALHMDTVISVAVCDRPDGKYQFHGHVHFPDGKIWGRTKGDPNCFDPGVLVDDDGQVYLYCGFSPKKGFMRSAMAMRGRNLDGSWCAKLEKDMLTIQGEPKLVVHGCPGATGTDFAQHPFYEASSIRKFGDSYYFIYASQAEHELCYATAQNPMGPFSFCGVLLSNGNIKNGSPAVNYTGNNHGSIAKINGEYYIFGHRQTNQTAFSRQGIAEKLARNPDGSFQQAELTSCGLNGGPLAGVGEYPAYIACNLSSKEGCYFYSSRSKSDAAHPYFTQSGEDREENGDQYIANMKDGSWAGFKYFDIAQVSKVCVSVRGTAQGELLVQTSLEGPVCCQIPITPSDGWHACEAEATLPEGIRAIYFTYQGTGAVNIKAFTLLSE